MHILALLDQLVAIIRKATRSDPAEAFGDNPVGSSSCIGHRKGLKLPLTMPQYNATAQHLEQCKGPQTLELAQYIGQCGGLKLPWCSTASDQCGGLKLPWSTLISGGTKTALGNASAQAQAIAMAPHLFASRAQVQAYGMGRLNYKQLLHIYLYDILAA